MVRPRKLTSNPAAVTEIQRAKFILRNINWSFSTPFSVGRSGIDLIDARKYHWFPASFIPEIPYTLIEILSEPEATVYDPFAGIGTTVFQCLMLGRQPLATEICRVAVAYMKSLWDLLRPNSDLERAALELIGLRAKYDPRRNYARKLGEAQIRVDSLEPWFNPETFNQLMYLAWAGSALRVSSSASAFFISVSATLKAVCAQDAGWGCIADNVSPKPEQLRESRNAFDRFERNVHVLLTDTARWKTRLPAASHALLSKQSADQNVFRVDVRELDLVPQESVDLVVTSPPYPNMTDYSFSQRLSYYWLGADPTDDVVLEIGARRKRSKPNALQNYTAEMGEALKLIAGRIKPGGYCCLVMPEFNTDNQNNTARRRTIVETLAALPNEGLVLDLDLERILPTRRRQHNQEWTSLERERIYVYRKME